MRHRILGGVLLCWIPSVAVAAGQTPPPSAQVSKPASDPARAEAFSAAVRRGDLAAVRQLLDAGIDVNTKFRYDATAIAFASDRGHVEIVTLLIERGADVNARDTFYKATPLTWAAGPAMARTPGHAEVVRLLLKAGATGSAGALSSAVGAKDAPMVKVILDHGGLSPGALTSALETAKTAKATDVVALLEAAGAKPAPEISLTDAQLARYVGTYEMSAEMHIVITVVGNRLQLDASQAGGPKTSLVARSETQFGAPDVPGLTATFQMQENNVVGMSIGPMKFVKRMIKP